uniref:Uncharacterized protein n=1 Tax=Anguilla anguilla TaxID=7936 RepID=A0A0E9VC93_ANGAN
MRIFRVHVTVKTTNRQLCGLAKDRSMSGTSVLAGTANSHCLEITSCAVGKM